jgi:ribonuclease HI
MPPMGEIVALYTDGGCVGPNPSKLGGTTAWCGVDAEGCVVVRGGSILTPARATLPTVSNNVAELWAVMEALQAMPDGWNGTLFCDNLLTLQRLWGTWPWNNVPDWMKDRAQGEVARMGIIIPVLLAGHPTKKELAEGVSKEGRLVSPHNVACDKECQRQAKVFLAMQEEMDHAVSR